jgi:hypothetical protein
MRDMKRYKFQALVHFSPQVAGQAAELPPGLTRYLVVRGEHREDHHSKIFSAMVTRDTEALPQRAEKSSTVTMVVVGDDVPQYLEPGDHFVLWAGDDIGHGVVSRRLFI